ncbi:vitamin B12 dependent-methionine synthase activation domain-containing protein [Sorangium sp. So ce590]
MDGAMGTTIRTYGMKEADIRGKRFADSKKDLLNNGDLFTLTQPEMICDIHRRFLEAGADIIETNTFGATSITQSEFFVDDPREHGGRKDPAFYQGIIDDPFLNDLSWEINEQSARQCREWADRVANADGRQRFVAGAIGPLTVSLSNSPDADDSGFRVVTFDQVKEAYVHQIRALIAGGSDVLLVETIFDSLNAKAALVAIREVFDKDGKTLPVMISAAVGRGGETMISAQTVEAFWTAVKHVNPLAVGLNCSLGPDLMYPFLSELSEKSSAAISCYPNAGLPNPLSPTGFDLEPPDMVIGGATTSKAHTAVKVAPHYSEPVVHVVDASRAVPVTTSLLSEEGKPAFVAQHRAEYERLRQIHRAPKHKLVPLEAARANRTRIEWRAEDLPVPEFTGARVLEDFPLATLREYIDWTPFFHTWELKGVYPRILEHAKYGEQARQLFSEANALLDRIIEEKLLTARGVYGFFAASAVGDDVEVYADGTRTTVLERLHFLRQQTARENGEPNRSLVDFIAPKETGLPDHIAGFAVTSGIGLKELCERFRASYDDYNAIMAEAIADRLAEAFAECLHKRVRDEWGYGRQEDLTKSELIEEKYRGIRPAAGYPACPDHTEKGTLWRLLDVEKNTGIQITESFAMWPGSSVSGLYFAHPQARYFSLGKIDRDQVVDYHVRKGMTVADVERWLGQNLNYDASS